MLTDGDEDDATQAPALLRQPEGIIASLTADCAYDRDPVYQAAVARQSRSPIEVVVPPRADAVLGTADPDQQSPRDRHVQHMADRGRMGWQRATGYGKRNHAETTMGRYKHLIGPKLRVRTRPGQSGEVALAVQALNRMIRTASPSPSAAEPCGAGTLQPVLESVHQRHGSWGDHAYSPELFNTLYNTAPLKVVAPADDRMHRLYKARFTLIRLDQHVAWQANALPEDPAGLLRYVTRQRG